MRCANPQLLLSALVSMAICFVSSIGLAQVAPGSSLSVDMPHGGCSLTARQDGSASIHFGAMARWVSVEPGTFDFDQLASDLHKKSYPQDPDKARGPLVGSLSLPTNKALLLIDDEELVRSLLKRAWKARIPPKTPVEIENYEWVSGACQLQ